MRKKEPKKEIRLLGIDDAPFDKFRDRKTIIIGTFFRGGDFLDGILSTTAEVDGSDGTGKIIKLVQKSKFRTQLRAILLDGISVGGFNVIDIERLHKKTRIPVIVVMRRRPNSAKIHDALRKLKMGRKIRLLERAGPIYEEGKIFIQFKGIGLNEARKIIRISISRAYIPEPIRVAHLIAAGLVYGESSGKA